MDTHIRSNQVFSEKWWNTLLEDSNYLTEACLIKGSVSEQLFNEQDLLNIFRQVTDKLEFGTAGLRVYVDGGQHVGRMSDIYNQPIQENENLMTFTQRIFGNQKFGIILNRLTAYHPNLARQLAPLYQGLVEKLGVKWIDLNATLFVGNYGYTPFGVHYDGEANSVIHFHYGPGKKLMTLWDEDTFVEKTGSQRHYLYPEKILPYGTTFQIESNDTFYLPEGYFHIGNTEEFSVGLTVIIKGISVNSWVTNAFVDMNTKSLNHEILDSYETDIVEILQNGLVVPEMSDKSYSTWIAEAMEDYQLSLKSNCGFKPPRWSGEATYPNLGQQSVQIITPFQIFYKALPNNELRVYYRRNKQNFAHALVLISVIDRLNGKEVMEMAKVLEQHVSEKEFLLEFFALLLNHQAIELV